ncbi:hypothetical protein [Ramlibacter paludis]|nr:hypothetical protein [Ramlibacter paludis]
MKGKDAGHGHRVGWSVAGVLLLAAAVLAAVFLFVVNHMPD